MELMDAGLEVPLTLVSAPAGYGKSVLVSQWSESLTLPSAWLSLGEADGEVDQFLMYLIAAVQTAIPEACPETEVLVGASTLPPVKVLASSLANELDALEAPLVLVLDDYHRLAPLSAVHGFLALLLEHPPRPLRLVLITRRDPPIPLASLRGGGGLAEIRLQDLRFTELETSEFLEKTAEVQASPEALSNLQDQIEGWAVGLQLVTLNLREVEDPDEYLRGLRGGIEQTQKYLVEQVLQWRSPAMQDWMLQTSILDRFCAELCDSVCAPTDPASDLDARQFIDALRRGNLFTISLDTMGQWFRYHHLFRELLNQQLVFGKSPDEITMLHVRASKWLERHGLIEEAIHHALEAGDAVGGAVIVERNQVAEFDIDRLHTVERWLAMLPVELRQERPQLLLAEAAILVKKFQLDRIPPLLDRTQALLGDPPDENPQYGELCFNRGWLSCWQGDLRGSEELLNKALMLVPREPGGRLRAELELQAAFTASFGGRKDEAIRALEERLAETSPYRGLIWERAVFGLALLHIMGGDLVEGARFANLLVEDSLRTSKSYVTAWGALLSGIVAFHRFDLEEARRHFQTTVENRYVAHGRAAVDAMVGLVVCHQLAGRPDEADRNLREAREFSQWTRDPDHIDIARSCEARVALLRGDLSTAFRWQRSFVWEPQVPTMVVFLANACISECRVLLAMGAKADLREAAEKLEYLREAASALHYTCQVIEVAALQSLVLQGLGQGARAETALAEALALAEPGGWIRPFVELGPPMADLLRHQLRQEPGNDFIRQIVSAFAPDGPAQVQAPASTDLVEPLTVREEEVLELLSDRLRDKEIAQELGISRATVKYHLRNLYQKLAVHGRRDAVNKAREIHLITSD
jgi:LuxR family maltose regulon positive regulatory protein